MEEVPKKVKPEVEAEVSRGTAWKGRSREVGGVEVSQGSDGNIPEASPEARLKRIPKWES